MLKHCSTSYVDVSRQSRRSLRHSSLTLDNVLSVSTDLIDQFSGSQFSQLCSSQCSSLCDGLITLPRYPARVPTRSESSDQEKIDSENNNDVDSLHTFPATNTIRVYATCLRPHLAYKTVMITPHTTSKQVILGLLSRFRMKHRDPKLFYLTMEVTVSQTFQTITLEDNSRPAEMISCNPWGGCKFILRSKTGGLVKIYDHQIRPDSVYKSIIISRETTVSDTLSILWSCYPQLDCQNLCLAEYSPTEDFERILDGGQCPLQLMEAWGEEYEYRLVIKLRDAEDDDDENDPPDEHIFSRLVITNSNMRQSVRKKTFLRSMIGDLKEDKDYIVEGGSDISIANESAYAEDDSMSTSSSGDSVNIISDTLVIDSFYT